ncbi:MAG: SDR family NAD(P)-dependent oxidoreductase [Acidimicrobiales bacterium]
MSPRWKRALVTGASSGIGEAMARQLAAEGTDLVVVARDEARLRALASELGEDRVEVLVADLADAGALAGVEARLGAEPPIDLLVNNAGFGFTGDFVELDIERECAVLAVNVEAVVRLSHAAGAAMRSRGRGGILNVSSIAGEVPAPNNATYGATKAFVTRFSEALHLELRDSGVHVSALLPGFTRTEFQTRAEYDTSKIPAMLWDDASTVAGIGLAGVDRNKPVVVPTIKYRSAVALNKLTPAVISRRLSGLFSE